MGKTHGQLNKFWKTIKNAFSSEEKKKIVLFELPKDKCTFCDALEAKWKNKVLMENACNNCVPRGCSCKLQIKQGRTGLRIQDYEYCIDRLGNELPCEDWEKI